MPLANRTRRSPSIARRLLREGKLHLLPLYALLRTSDLAREGMERSGSYQFADHIYAGRASGRALIGRPLDRLLLALPSARSFRNRYHHVKETLLGLVRASDRPLHIVSVPSGIPRDLVEAARGLEPAQLARLHFSIVDLDDGALADARGFTERSGLSPLFEAIQGDALSMSTLPCEVDVITSTGFTEFLTDDDVTRFFRNCHSALAAGGTLVTSFTVRHRASAWLMEELAELQAHYRDEHDAGRLLRAGGFTDFSMGRDRVGYQVLVVARKRSGGSS